MRSSSGSYFVGLDHLRAIAAFLVFFWHYNKIGEHGIVAPEDPVSSILLALPVQGHTGVSLFLVLSGYLMAKITDGRDLDSGGFYRSRLVRLMPLLILVCLIRIAETAYFKGPAQAGSEAWSYLGGAVFPTWPNGGWSIAIELQFYICFPLLLLVYRRGAWLLLALVAGLIAFRMGLIAVDSLPDPQEASYRTIFGRVDQFLIGMVVHRFSDRLVKRHALALACLLGICLQMRLLTMSGGFNYTDLPDMVWGVWFTLEGAFYGVLIGYYDRSFRFSERGFSGLVAQVGAASYSIYLLHRFVVEPMYLFTNGNVLPLDGVWVVFLTSLLWFVLVAAGSWIVYRTFECYWMRFRRPYVAPNPA